MHINLPTSKLSYLDGNTSSHPSKCPKTCAHSVTPNSNLHPQYRTQRGAAVTSADVFSRAKSGNEIEPTENRTCRRVSYSTERKREVVHKIILRARVCLCVHSPTGLPLNFLKQVTVGPAEFSRSLNVPREPLRGVILCVLLERTFGTWSQNAQCERFYSVRVIRNEFDLARFEGINSSE